MKVRWSAAALIELDEIFAYISKRNERAARAVVARIELASEQLESFPFSGVETDDGDSYVLPIIRYPYMLYYSVDVPGKRVVILHVRHTARKKPAADDPRAG
jgi:toxin ParE1/3/4